MLIDVTCATPASSVLFSAAGVAMPAVDEDARQHEALSLLMSSPSDDENVSDEAILPGPSRRFFEEETNVDDTLCTLLASLHLEQSRDKRPSDHDDEVLRKVHECIQAAIQREHDDSRRRRLRRALQPSNCVREQVYYLRRTPRNGAPAPSYFPRLSTALSTVVNESFDEEYRKVAVLLGLVEALAEVLVLEVTVFGSLPRLPEHRSIRKLIANALTNLTFGHVSSKRRLCSYSGFLPTVIKIVQDARNLAQVYAGLIRNLSWLADTDMSIALSPCVSTLSRAAINARQCGDEGCVRATLSAVWNLASHSMENKRAICDEPGCLRMLISLLTPNADHTIVVESASGILKYASQYLATTSSHLEERTILTNELVKLLTSASFTISCNALSALSNLIAKDPHLQALVRSNSVAMHQLNSLLDSKRDDIRTAVKNVLNHLNQPNAYIPRYKDMSSSMGAGYEANVDHGRLLPLRAIRASPGCLNTAATFQSRSSSLPRHFARGGCFVNSGGQSINISSGSARVDPPLSVPSGQLGTLPDDKGDERGEPSEWFDEEDDVEVASANCNRSNASRQSLESDFPNQSGWTSMLETANNSNRLSPVSPSELPDSPTHYTLIKQQKDENNSVETSAPLQVQVSVRGFDNSENLNSGLASRLTSSDAATAIVEDQPTPSFNLAIEKSDNLNQHEIRSDSSDDMLPGPYLDTDCDYAVLEDVDLLQRSIEAALPPATPNNSRRCKQLPHSQDTLLTDVIESALPSTSCRDDIQSSMSSDSLLRDCIMSAMPSSPISTVRSSKNGKDGRTLSAITSDRPSLQDRPLTVLNSDTQDINDESYIDTSLPMDCLEEDLTIDCSSITISAKKNIKKLRSAIPQPTKTLRCQPGKYIRPAIARSSQLGKPQTQAVVSPYNYKEPNVSAVEDSVKSTEGKNTQNLHSNAMLVTTV